MKELFISTFFVIVLAASSFGGDSPHGNDVVCNYCHATGGTGLAPSPFWGKAYTPADVEQTSMNLLCLGCHDQPTGGSLAPTSAIQARTHSSNATGTKYGTWSVECVACHNPHYQRQYVYYRNLEATRLVQGTVNSIAFMGTNYGSWQGIPVSVITYTLNAAGTKAAWTDPATWYAKSSADRGTIIYPNSANTAYPFNILAADATTITVRGDVSAGINAGVLGAGKSFVITYGDLMKEKIYAPGKTDPVTFKSPTVGTVGPSTGSPVKLLDKTGPNSFAVNDLGGAADTTRDGICQVCHTLTAHWRYDGTLADHNSGTNCMTCHPHTQGFKTSCSFCHGSPPVDAGSLVSNPGTTGSATAGAHSTHVVAKGYTCEYCHANSAGSGTTHNSGLMVSMGFAFFSESVSVGAYDGQTGAFYDSSRAGTTVTKTGTKTCSNIYCHGATMAPNGGSNITPTWDSSVTGACGTCHGATAAEPPTRGSHEVHTGTMYQLALSCDKCHSGYENTHVNGKSEVSFSQTDPRMSGTLYLHTYNGTQEMLDSYKPCVLYCHSDIQKNTGYIGTGVITYTPKTWGVAGTWCGSCHSSNMQTGSHGGHPGISCSRCHNGAGSRTPMHADYNIDIYFDPLNPSAHYSQEGPGNNPPGNGYGTCSNMYCHGGSSPVWGSSSMACNACHKANNALAGSHAMHYGTATIATSADRTPGNSSAGSSYVFSCGVCHYVAPHADGPMSADQSAFVNLDAVYAGGGSFSPGVPQGSDGGFNWTKGQCNNSYCHSIGTSVSTGTITANTSPKWGSGSLACNACHNYPPDYPNGSPKANSHPAHNSKTCNICHSATTLNGTSVTNHANHVNRAYNLEAGGGPSFSYSYSATGGSCSIISCHGGGSATWGTRIYCDGCHGAPPSTGAHKVHFDGTVSEAVYGDEGRVTNDPQRYKFNCGNCHPTDRAKHADGTVDLELYNAFSTGFKMNNPATASKSGTGTSTVCNDVYCHSNGANGANRAYRATPEWGSTFPNNRCASCHDDPPQYAGQSHYTADGFMGREGGHLVGIHFDNIHSGTYGLIPPGGTVGSGAAHGDPNTSTTMSCNTCHAATVTARNTWSAQWTVFDCTICHGMPEVGSIADKTMHINADRDVLFMSGTFRSKAQLSDAAFSSLLQPMGWTRNNGYKLGTDSHDSVNFSGSYNSDTKTCITSCHLNQTAVWGDTTVNCLSCHADL